MGVEAPETRWAKHKRQVMDLWNCCIWLVNLYEMLCCVAWLKALAHTRVNNTPEQIVQFGSFFCFLNTATTRLCGRRISCHLMASLRDNKLSKSSWYVKIFTTTIKKGALTGDEVQVRVLKVLLPLALLQHDGKTLHYKFHIFRCND
jgi:hypothetical protein